MQSLRSETAPCEGFNFQGFSSFERSDHFGGAAIGYPLFGSSVHESIGS